MPLCQVQNNLKELVQISLNPEYLQSFYMLSVKYVQSGMQKTAFRLHSFRRGEVWPYVVALEQVSIV